MSRMDNDGNVTDRIKLSSLIGKTIVGIERGKTRWNDYVMTFSDGSACVIISDSLFDSDGNWFEEDCLK